MANMAVSPIQAPGSSRNGSMYVEEIASVQDLGMGHPGREESIRSSRMVSQPAALLDQCE